MNSHSHLIHHSIYTPIDICHMYVCLSVKERVRPCFALGAQIHFGNWIHIRNMLNSTCKWCAVRISISSIFEWVSRLRLESLHIRRLGNSVVSELDYVAWGAEFDPSVGLFTNTDFDSYEISKNGEVLFHTRHLTGKIIWRNHAFILIHLHDYSSLLQLNMSYKILFSSV